MTLEQWMAERKWTDADLAERVHGLSRSQISRIRRRKSIPSPQTAKKLEVVTGIPAAEFIFGRAA